MSEGGVSTEVQPQLPTIEKSIQREIDIRYDGISGSLKRLGFLREIKSNVGARQFERTDKVRVAHLAKEDLPYPLNQQKTPLDVFNAVTLLDGGERGKGLMLRWFDFNKRIYERFLLFPTTYDKHGDQTPASFIRYAEDENSTIIRSPGFRDGGLRDSLTEATWRSEHQEALAMLDSHLHREAEKAPKSRFGFLRRKR